MSEGFVERDTDLFSILSSEALAALPSGPSSGTRSYVRWWRGCFINWRLVGGLQKHFERNKIGEKDTTFHMKFGDIEFDVNGVKQNLGQTLDSTGLTIWRAVEHLCEWIMKNSNVFAGKHVCELGGLGVCVHPAAPMVMKFHSSCWEKTQKIMAAVETNHWTTGRGEAVLYRVSMLIHIPVRSILVNR